MLLAGRLARATDTGAYLDNFPSKYFCRKNNFYNVWNLVTIRYLKNTTPKIFVSKTKNIPSECGGSAVSLSKSVSPLWALGPAGSSQPSVSLGQPS